LALESVVAQIKVDEERKREVTAEYEALEEACGTHAFDYATVMLEVQERAADVRAVLSRHTPEARPILRKLAGWQDRRDSPSPWTGGAASGRRGG
jgi:hypothetical protein